MAKQLFANNASALLAASISDSDLTIQVQSTFGELFPNPGADEEFIVALINASGDIEYCRCTSRTGDLLTVASGGRGFDGSSPESWTNGQTRVEYRLTKAVMEAFIQRGGDTMEGNLDMDGNDLIDAHITGADTIFDGGQIVGVPLRGTADDSSNEVAVPGDGSPATSGGSVILTVADSERTRTAVYEVGMIMMWHGAAVDCPDGWAICNGSNGTPDLRDRFVVGAGATYALDASGGATTLSGSTGNAGAHDHGAATGGHALTAAENGPHTHNVWGHTSGVPTGTNDALSIGAVTGEVDGTHGYTGTAQGQQILSTSGSGTAHSHDIAAVADHSHSLSGSILPPYKALYYIMFIGF